MTTTDGPKNTSQISRSNSLFIPALILALAIGGGLAAAGATSMLLEVIDHNTGIVSDVGNVIDDIFSF